MNFRVPALVAFGFASLTALAATGCSTAPDDDAVEEEEVGTSEDGIHPFFCWLANPGKYSRCKKGTHAKWEGCKKSCVPDEPPPPTCANIDCMPGDVCVMKEVQCVTTPCHPQPTCVPAQPQCGPDQAVDPSTGECQCLVQALCIEGFVWDETQCACVNPCAAMLCPTQTTCKVVNGEGVCEPLTPCQKTGCSGEICSDEDIASVCIWKPEFACYATAECKRQANGACGFTQTKALTSCVANSK